MVCLGAGSTPQQAFLGSSFKLCSKKGNHQSARKLKDGQKPRANSYENFVDIELSSPLGRHIVTSSKLGLDAQTPASSGFKPAEEFVKEVEKHCPTTSRVIKSCNNVKKRWLHTFKGSRKKWVHRYCFTNSEREKQVKELRCGLPTEVMRLLQGAVEGGGVNPEDVAVVDQKSDVVDDDDGEVVEGSRGFNVAIHIDEKEGGDGNLNLPSDVEAELSETEAEGVRDIGTEDISEYEKIRAVYVKQKEKLKRKLKRDWDGCKEGEGLFVTGGQKRAKKLKVVQKEALDLRSEGEDQQCGKSTKKNLGSSGAGLDIWI